jgi:hypothetical protein
LRPLAARASLVEGDAKTRLVDIMRKLTNSFYENNAERERGQVLADLARGTDQLDKLQLEISLIGESNRVRAVAIAQMEAENYVRDHPGASADDAQRYIEQQKDIARLTENLATGQTNYNNALSYTADLLGLINEQAQNTASVLSGAFGGFGDSIGSALTALTNYQAQEAAFDKDRRAAIKTAGNDASALAKIETLYAAKSANARMAATGQVIGSLKGLFKEHSAGYKVMSAIEKAYALFQAAETIASIVRDATKDGVQRREFCSAHDREHGGRRVEDIRGARPVGVSRGRCDGGRPCSAWCRGQRRWLGKPANTDRAGSAGPGRHRNRAR